MRCRRFASGRLGSFFSLVLALERIKLTGIVIRYNYQRCKDLTCFLGGVHGCGSALM
jgi:hypothetical protein